MKTELEKIACGADDELLCGAIREAEIRGRNFAVLRNMLTGEEYIFLLPSFDCTPKDHADVARNTSATVCHRCQEPLYSKDGSGLIKITTRGDVDQLLTDLDRRLKEDLSIERRTAVLSNKAVYLASVGRASEAMEVAQEAYALLPNTCSKKALIEALFMHGRVEELEPLLRDVANDPECELKDRLHYATALRYLGRVHEAAKIERAYHCSPSRFLPYWQGGPCQVLHIVLEDGFGDCLYNLRSLGRIKARGVQKIVICVPPQYGKDFAQLLRAQPWMPEVVMVPDDFSTLRRQITCAIGSSDIDCTLDSTLSEIPAQPLWTARKKHKKKYQHFRQGKPLLGICWTAAQANSPWIPGGVLRSLTDDQVVQIVREVRGAQFVSLQFKKEPPVPEITSAGIDSWLDTAGLLANLDAVVCIDTSVMHLANGMQIPTFVLSSGAMDWRLKYAETFYPGVKLFRNPALGFGNAIQSLIESLNCWIPSVSQQRTI